MIKAFIEVWKNRIVGNIEDFEIGLKQLESEIRTEVIDEIVEDISREYPECNYVADWVERLNGQNK